MLVAGDVRVHRLRRPAAPGAGLRRRHRAGGGVRQARRHRRPARAARPDPRPERRRPRLQRRAEDRLRRPEGAADLLAEDRQHQDRRRRRRRRTAARPAAGHDAGGVGAAADGQPIPHHRQGHHADRVATDRRSRHPRHLQRADDRPRLSRGDEHGAPRRVRPEGRHRRRRRGGHDRQRPQGHARQGRLPARPGRDRHPGDRRGRPADGQRLRRPADHRRRPAVVRPEPDRQHGHEEPGPVRLRRGPGGQDRQAACGGVVPDLRPGGRRQDRSRRARQPRVPGRLRTGFDRQGHVDVGGHRGEGRPADDAAHRPEPAAPLRHVVQGRRRPPDAEPHGRGRPRHVEQHRHDAGDREGRAADDVRLLPQVRHRLEVRGRVAGRVRRASSRSPRTGAVRSATPSCSGRATRSMRSRPPGSTRPSPTVASASRRASSRAPPTPTAR